MAYRRRRTRISLPPEKYVDIVETFDSTEAFLSACASDTTTTYHYVEANFACMPPSEAIRLTRIGDESLVLRAERYLDKLAIPDLDVRSWQWYRSPQGVYPCIPDVLCDSPTPMRHRRKMIADTAPINLYLSVATSASITTELLMQRGLCVTALAMALQRVRPVRLYATMEGGNLSNGLSYFGCVNLDCSPLNLSQVAFIMSSPGFSRGLCVGKGSAKTQNRRGILHWSNAFYKLGGSTGEQAYIDYLRNVYSAGPQDVIIPGAHITTMTNDPVQWLQGMLEKILGTENN